jgi:ABC1 atypical kinase-like domain
LSSSAIIPNTITELEGHNTNKSSISTTVPVRPLLQLDPKPIGSDCIAQVYKGVLLQSIDQFHAGTEIAVKALHPNIFHGVCCDFYIYC